MRSLALQLRQAARDALPEPAFLRRDRGGALFVSDAPRHCPDGDWRERLARAGFDLQKRDGLVYFSPGPAWLMRLEAACPAPPDPFCEGLARFAGHPPDAESLALFALGARVLDGAPDDGRFERRLRQRAAQCLRRNRTQNENNGGGLYACALVKFIIEEATT